MTGLGLRLTIAVILATGLAALAKSAPTDRPSRDGLPEVRPNDNREPAGELIGTVLMLRLEVRMGRWCPERENGPFVVAPAFAEEGKTPQVPGPLIRVRTGTTIVATIRNALPDSSVTLHGFATRPSSPSDSIVLKPGESRVIRFGVGAAGTYFYRAVVGTIDHDKDEQEQLAGAFIVDPPGGRQDDRIFVINIWGDQVDSTQYLNALAINGRSWPYTERISAAEGDSVRWRVINASVRVHPMHLHGFYYQVLSKGNSSRDTAYGPASRRLVVTEDLRPYQTMTLAWQPMREGNWLFHCHLAFHATPDTRLEPMEDHHDNLATDPRKHMGGLVLGLSAACAAPGPGRASARARAARDELHPAGRIGPASHGFGPHAGYGHHPHSRPADGYHRGESAAGAHLRPLARARAAELVGRRCGLERQWRKGRPGDRQPGFLHRPSHDAPRGDLHLPHAPERSRAAHIGPLRCDRRARARPQV